MEELLVPVGAGLFIVLSIGIPWVIICVIAFNRIKH